MNPRVALVTRSLRCGGVSTFLFRLGRELIDHGCTVELVATEERGDWFDLAVSRGFQTTCVEGAATTPVRRHAGKVGAYLRDRNFDAVLLNHAFHAQAALGMLRETTFVAPIIHNDIEEVLRVGLGNPAAWNLAIAVSPRMLELAEGRRPDRPRTLIAHGIEIPSEAPAWIDRKAGASPLQLIYVGSIETERKGVMTLPRIARSLLDRGRRFHLTIVGGGPDTGRLTAGMRDAGCNEMVEWLGTIEPERVRDRLAESHVLILPSRHEGFGLVLTEAQACGCVPIATRLPGITDFAIEDGRTGRLFEVDDAGAAVSMIEQMDAHREGWRAMATSGHEMARERFEVSQMGSAYLQLIEDGLAGRYPLPGPRRERPAVDPEMLTWRDALPPRMLAILRRLRHGGG